MLKTERYHHGDLRQALIEAGLAILEADGLDALSLRAIAARAGVSHAAPAHHFRNLSALFTGLAAVGFERFSAAMAHERSVSPGAPGAQMQAAGRGYLAFARTNPGLFRLMFSGPQLDWDDPPLRIAADAAKQHLSEISAPAAARAGDTSVAGQHRMQTLVWSLLHGYVRLLLDCESAIPGHVPGRPPSIPDLSALLFPDAASEPQIFARQHRRKEA